MHLTQEENNQVTITGEIITEIRYSHTLYGEKFYKFEVLVERLSEQVDVLPVMISENLIDCNGDYRCERIRVTGQFRSFHYRHGNERHLLLMVFAEEVLFLDKEDEGIQTNEIYLNGFLCKIPKYRRTPRGKEITDTMIAVNRTNGQIDYIPCIFWGKNARYTIELGLGGAVQIWGRIQSREYRKRDGENHFVTKIAYEVSVNRLG